MSDRNYDPSEDRAIELAWNQVMATGSEPRLLQGGGEADAALVREYTELLGLLPYELEAEAPSPPLKERILAQAAGAPAVGAPVAGENSAEPLTTHVVPLRRPAPSGRSPWAFARAAALAASLVGVGFLGAVVWQQSRQIEQLSGQLAAASGRQGEAALALEELRAVRSRLDMVTNVARHVYPLRTVSHVDAPRQPEGIVYVCGAHQQWYLTLRGLEPPAAGGEYHLWFMTEAGKVDGGRLEVRDDASSEMEALTMPSSTQGFLVTLEQQDEPEGLAILLGDTPINL